MSPRQELATARQVGDDRDVARDVVVKLLVTEAEREAMQAAADRAGLKLSEWIRQRCFETTVLVPPAVHVPPSRTRQQRNKASAKLFAAELAKSKKG